MTEEEREAATRTASYLVDCLSVLADERDPAVVMATLSTLVTIALDRYGVTIETFATRVRECVLLRVKRPAAARGGQPS